jgi:hypothetical protein
MTHYMSFLHKLFGIDGGRSRLSVTFPVDLGKQPLPKNPRDLLPVSLWCDESSFYRVVRAYDDLFSLFSNEFKENVKAEEKVTYLNKIARAMTATYWQEVIPFIPSAYWIICWRPLSSEEAASIPLIGSSVVLQEDIGMLTNESEDVVFLRIEPTRRSGVFPPNSPIGKPFDLDYAESQIQRHGWKRGMI